MGIILAILVFGIIVFIHELGHFLLAKANKIRVDEFSIGMGPALFTTKKKKAKEEKKEIDELVSYKYSPQDEEDI